MTDKQQQHVDQQNSGKSRIELEMDAGRKALEAQKGLQKIREEGITDDDIRRDNPLAGRSLLAEQLETRAHSEPDDLDVAVGLNTVNMQREVESRLREHDPDVDGPELPVRTSMEENAPHPGRKDDPVMEEMANAPLPASAYSASDERASTARQPPRTPQQSKSPQPKSPQPPKPRSEDQGNK